MRTFLDGGELDNRDRRPLAFLEVVVIRLCRAAWRRLILQVSP